jgi:hypothetical protein
VEIPYNDSEEQMTYISIATGGSLNIDRDITATIAEAGIEPVDDYNFKYLEEGDIQYQMLEQSAYRIPEKNVVIKKGEIYGQVPVYINTAGLHCDSLYALTFKISSVSDPDYISIRQEDSVLIQTYTFINDYSGTYQSEGYYYQLIDGKAHGDSTSISATRTLKATNVNTVRLFHLAHTESDENIDPYALTLSVASGNSLEVKAWGSLDITDGRGTYSPDDKIFTIWYNYKAGDQEYQFSGTFTNSDS